MGQIYVGSTRHDENGRLENGSASDRFNPFNSDSEVIQQKFYNHPKGWDIIRPIMPASAESLASTMVLACSNSNIVYDQENYEEILEKGIKTSSVVECNCATLVRACVKQAMGCDAGKFTTENELAVLMKTKLFQNIGKFVSQEKTPIFNGDILVTRITGITAIVTQGNKRKGVSAPEIAKPVIRPGYSGENVLLLQKDLNFLGYTDNCGKSLVENGETNEQTMEALKKFQLDNGMRAKREYNEKCYSRMKLLF